MPLQRPEFHTRMCRLSRRLQLTAQGIELRRGRESRRFSWDDVLILRLIRERVKHVFVHRLGLQLRGGDAISGGVNSVRIDGQRIWAIGNRNADRPQRMGSLTPPHCWQVFQTFGDLQSRAEGEFRLAHWRKKRTTARRVRAVLPPVCLALSGSAFIPKLFVCWNAQFFPPWWKAVALVCLALAILVGVVAGTLGMPRRGTILGTARPAPVQASIRCGRR